MELSSVNDTRDFAFGCRLLPILLDSSLLRTEGKFASCWNLSRSESLVVLLCSSLDVSCVLVCKLSQLGFLGVVNSRLCITGVCNVASCGV